MIGAGIIFNSRRRADRFHPGGADSVVTAWHDVDMSAQTPAGWYPDGQGNERYWNGEEWTQEIRPPSPPAGAEVKRGGALNKLTSVVRQAAADRQAAKEEANRQHAEAEIAAGRLVTSGVFGTSTVEIYANGFVRVAVGEEASETVAVIKKGTPYERLRSIRYTPSDEELAAAAAPAPSILDGALGAAVGGLLKGGKTLMKGSVPGIAAAGVAQGISHLASVSAKTALLTISTDKAIHTLSNQRHNGLVKVVKKGDAAVGRELESAGNATLGTVEPAALDEEPSPPIAPTHSVPAMALAAPQASLTDRLRELAALHAEGILSDEEFTETKARLISGL